MSNPNHILVFCDRIDCPLYESGRPLDDLQAAGWGLPDLEQAKQSTVLCRICQTSRPARDGGLIYLTAEELAVISSLLYPGSGMKTAPYWQTVTRWTNSAVPTSSDGAATHDPEVEPRDGIAVGVVIDTIPYGGYLLRYGDKDNNKQYGPRQDDLPLQDPAKPNYILQLQDDLIFLGYWNTSRAGKSPAPVPGEYHYSMMGAILALKEDLTTFYGVSATKDLTKTKIRLDSESKFNLRGLALPIFYDRELRNPSRTYFREILDPLHDAHATAVAVASGWAAALKGQKNGKFTSSHRKKLKALVDSTEAALESSDRAVERAASLGGNWRAPTSAAALMGSACFEIDKTAGMGCWDSFEKAAKWWETNRDASNSQAISDCLTSINLFTPAKDEHSDAVSRCIALQDAYSKLFVSLEAALKVGWEVLGAIPDAHAAYQAELRKYSTVDWATAAYIHAIRNYVPIGSGAGAVKRSGGVLVFRFPDDGVDHDAPADLEQVYEMAIEFAKAADVPPQLVLERFASESGFEHTFKMSRFAATKAHKGVKITSIGTDFANWAAHGGEKSTFRFSELFTGGPGDWQRGGGGRGYKGPIIMSRGWGVSQITLGTHLEGVTEKGRASKYDNRHWVLGLPVAKTNEGVELPEFIATTEGVLRNGVNLFKNKFNDYTKQRNECTFTAKAGGKRYDCHSCLKRFDPAKDFERDGNSYRLNVAPERYTELLGNQLKDDADMKELPCSWLAAIMRYAGTGDRAFKRLKKTAKLVSEPKAGSLFEQYIKQLSK